MTVGPIRRIIWMGAVLAAFAAMSGAAAPGAGAATCGEWPGLNGFRIYTSNGTFFDFTKVTQPAPTRAETFATLYEGGTNPSDEDPPGPHPLEVSDAYDAWGALFVGPGGDASLQNLYYSPNNESCFLESGGREQVFPSLPLRGLSVQRKIHVPEAGLQSARILNLLTNRSQRTVTTSVQVGDTRTESNYGDLGSDGATKVRFSSSGDTALTTADRWAVTSDHSGGANSDPALAHIIDGPGAVKRISFVTLQGLLPAETPEDNLAWRWSDVRIRPGQTVALVSYAGINVLSTRDGADEDVTARAQAVAHHRAGPNLLFAGMSPIERAAVTNWRTPVRCGGLPVTIAGSGKRDVMIGTPRRDVIYSGAGNDVVRGRGGRDLICTGPGADKAFGGGGRDRLSGGPGRDLCAGGPPASGDRAKGCERVRGIP